MDAKYNRILDSLAFRLALYVLGFGTWLSITVLLLAAAGL
jgi:hypothetical protein